MDNEQKKEPKSSCGNLVIIEIPSAGEIDASEEIDFDNLYGWQWSGLLAKQPQFADKCDWSKLDGGDWAKLLARQPQFADKCDWGKLSLENLSDLFAQNPKLRALAKKKKGMRGKILQIVLLREWVSATYELGRKALTSGEIPNSRGWNEASDGPEMLSDVLDNTAFFVIAKPCDPFQREEGDGHTHSEAIIIRLDGKELVNRTLNKSNPGARLRFVDEGDLFDETPPQEGRCLYGAQWWKDLWWSWTVEVPKEFDFKKVGKLVIPFYHARTGANRYPQLWINPADIHYGDMKPNEATSGWHMDDGRPKGIDFWTVESDVPVPYDGPWTHVRD